MLLAKNTEDGNFKFVYFSQEAARGAFTNSAHVYPCLLPLEFLDFLPELIVYHEKYLTYAEEFMAIQDTSKSV